MREVRTLDGERIEFNWTPRLVLYIELFKALLQYAVCYEDFKIVLHLMQEDHEGLNLGQDESHELHAKLLADWEEQPVWIKT